MAASAENWIEYWDNDDFWARSPIWKTNSDLFLRRSLPHLKPTKEDEVLNIGCGVGYLERDLALMVKSILAVDTAPNFLKACEKTCAGLPTVQTAQLGEDYLDLSVFGRKFSLMMAVSVVQYYKDLGEIEALIRSAQQVALPNARLMLADLPPVKGPVGRAWDSFASLIQSFQEGYAGMFIRTTLNRFMGASRYKSFVTQHDFLRFRLPELQAMIDRMGLRCEFLTQSVSIVANRPSMIVYF